MKDSVKETISAIITSGCTLAATFGIKVLPELSGVLASCSPIMNLLVNRVLERFDTKSFARIECARLGICYSQLVAIIQSHSDKGDKISFPEFSSNEEFSKADEICEAVFKASIDDSQSIKSICYGNLLGNIPFQSKYDASASYLLIKTAEELSYDELCLLAVIDRLPRKNYFGIEEKAWQDDISASVLYANMLHIDRLGLLKRLPSFTSGRALDNHQISSFGHDLCDLLELKLLNNEDISNMNDRILKYLC